MHSLEETMFGLNDDDIPEQTLKQNEFECLNLNITCPGGLTPQAHLPVMVFIHGGDDRGHGSNWVYDGGALVRKSIIDNKPVIMVTFNFRLGLFGFAAGPQLRESGEDIGNYGLRDQRVLLEWLHHYIADFGGDPRRITLFGESSGAFDIVCHLLSSANETRPLFHRAIVQSAVFEYNVPDLAAAGSQLSRLISSLHLSTISQLRAIDADQLVKFGRSLRIVDDGTFLRHDWRDFISPENAHKHHNTLTNVVPKALAAIRSSTHSPKPGFNVNVGSNNHRSSIFQPLLIGDCQYDSMLWSTPISYWTSSAVTRRLKAVCQSLSKTNTLFHTYDISTSTPDDEITEHILELVNDARVAWPTDCFALNARREGGAVWRYAFDQEGPWSCIPHHAADLMYLFDTVPLPESSTRSIAGSSLRDAVSFSEAEMFPDSFSFDDDDDEDIKYPSVVRDEDAMSSEDGGWGLPSVASWSYSRVRDTMQEQWISFAYGEAPFSIDKVFVFGPEGETGERSELIFEGRRRRAWWKKAFEPLGMQVVHKLGVELSRGPPLRG